jgi:hypothetical protein
VKVQPRLSFVHSWLHGKCRFSPVSPEPIPKVRAGHNDLLGNQSAELSIY